MSAPTMSTPTMSRPAAPIRLYGGKLSGHSHRVELFLTLLSLPYTFIAATPADRATPQFLAMNAFGQIPVIDDDGTVLADSNAILVYLARRYDAGGSYLPEEPAALAAVQRWLSVAAGPIAYGPATARLAGVFKLPVDQPRAIEVANRLYGVMDGHLTGRAFLAADHPTLADIACYSYTRAAPEGGVSLAERPHVRAWLERLEALPRFLPMPAAPVA